MENSSIPNSNRAIGPTPTPSSKPLSPPSNAGRDGARSLPAVAGRPLRSCQKLTTAASAIKRWALSVQRWTFSESRRVKGAWWPSRSSKPLSVRHPPGRGRFDSYPLRLFIFDFRFSISDRPKPRAANCRGSCQLPNPKGNAFPVATALCRRVDDAPTERGGYSKTSKKGGEPT